MSNTDNAVGAEITTTSARTLYWTVTTDAEVNSTPKVALLGPRHTPAAATTWTDAQWTGPEVLVDVTAEDGSTVQGHKRRLALLVAGPAGPTAGDPLVVPAAGEYSTWVRVSTATDTVDIQGSLLEVR